jgi:hypothetical protein
MILDLYDKKTTAYKKAKELIADALDDVEYKLESEFTNCLKLTSKESAKVTKHIETIRMRILKSLNI